MHITMKAIFGVKKERDLRCIEEKHGLKESLEFHKFNDLPRFRAL